MYDFNLLNSASTTSQLPENLAAVASSTGSSLWVVVVIACGIPLSLFILEWVIGIFDKPEKSELESERESEALVYKEERSESEIVASKML